MSSVYFTPPQLAKRFGVNCTKIIGWIERGELIALNVAENAKGKRPRWRISQEAVEAFERKRSTSPAAAPLPRRRRKAGAAVEYV